MLYRGRHRRRISRGNVRLAALALALVGGTLAAPVAPIRAQASVDVDRTWPSWLKGPDIAINPPGPAEGRSEAPPVDVGYAITGDQLARYDITATLAGQQEVQAFVARLGDERGIKANPADFSVYGLPPIYLGELSQALTELEAVIDDVQHAITDFSPPTWTQVQEAANALLQKLREFRIGYSGHHPEIDELWAAYDSEVRAVQDFVTTFNPLQEAQELAALVTALINSINIDDLFRAAGVPPTSEVAEDPTAAPPIGAGDIEALVLEDEAGVGSVLVLPTGTSVALLGAAWNDGVIRVTTVLDTSPITLKVAGTGVDPDPSSGSKWRPAGGLRCMERKQNRTAWYDPCSWWCEHMNDGNNSRWTWGLVQYGTGKSKDVWVLDEIEVQSWRKTGTPDQDWIKWAPTSDMSAGHCTTTSVGVNVRAAYLETTQDLCDEWDIAKGEQPADFANRWKGYARRSERDTASVIVTDTPNGYLPHDTVSFDYYASFHRN